MLQYWKNCIVETLYYMLLLLISLHDLSSQVHYLYLFDKRSWECVQVLVLKKVSFTSLAVINICKCLHFNCWLILRFWHILHYFVSLCNAFIYI